MAAHLEVWRSTGREIVLLDGERVTIGRGPANDVHLPDDPRASVRHAVVEPVAGGWSVRDLGSSNGTLVGGTAVLAERALRHADELRIGNTRIVFSCLEEADLEPTERAAPPPPLTPRERDVLIALCRPLFGQDVFTEPASARQIADALVVGEAAVKQHLVNLYAKFGLVDGSAGRRRVTLANEAVRRGAVTLADLRDGNR